MSETAIDPALETTTLGRTGIVVSRLGFGGAPAGLTNYLAAYSPADAAQRDAVIAALHRALELGIAYFDTAPGYGGGAGEAIFGEALASAPAHRLAQIFLATKLSPTLAAARPSVEESLRRLRRDRLDLVQLHGSTYPPELADRILARGGLLDQLGQLQSEGLIRFIGFTSEDNNPAVYRFIATDRFDVMQIAYNLLFQHPYEPTRPFGSLLAAEAQGMGICTMRTLTSGLFQKWVQWVNPANTFDYNAALLQFVLANPLVDVALVGMRTPEMVEQNVAAACDRAARVDLDALHAKYV